MLKAIFNFFKKPVAPTAPTPYKIEEPVTEKPKAKKPTVKKATTRKPAVAAKTARTTKKPRD